jgi:HD-GYP domain-containing protein (c-di-GMP phosphodiesterase class II)
MHPVCYIMTPTDVFPDLLPLLRTPQPQDALARTFPVIEAFLTLMWARDPGLCLHGLRTARHAVMLGRELALSGEDLLHLHFAALLHDIGKLSLPDALLFKNAPLTAEEYVLVQSHPRSAAELLGSYPDLQVEALWIAHHHERWDGCGYPYGLRGNFIPLGSRILAVADTYDAIVSRDGSMRTGSHDSHFRMIQASAGTQFDPSLVDMFVDVLRRADMGDVSIAGPS